MSLQNIIDKLEDALKADTGVGGLNHATTGLQDRIFPIEGKHGEKLPLLSFFVVDSTLFRYMNGAIAHDLLVQFDIYAKKGRGSDNASDIEGKLYALLEGKSLAPTGFDRAVCTFNRRGAQQVEEDAIRITDEVRIQATDF